MSVTTNYSYVKTLATLSANPQAELSQKFPKIETVYETNHTYSAIHIVVGMAGLYLVSRVVKNGETACAALPGMVITGLIFASCWQNTKQETQASIDTKTQQKSKIDDYFKPLVQGLEDERSEKSKAIIDQLNGKPMESNIAAKEAIDAASTSYDKKNDENYQSLLKSAEVLKKFETTALTKISDVAVRRMMVLRTKAILFLEGNAQSANAYVGFHVKKGVVHLRQVSDRV